MNTPTDIICFAKDWNEPKTSNNHVMEELAKRHRVLWVNSVATRTPNLTSSNDIKKIIRKVREWFRGAQIVHDRLRVFTPVSLPLPSSRLAHAINRWLVGASVRHVARRWGFRSPQLWTFLPNVGDFVGHFNESLVIYYCTDEWTGFKHLNPDYIHQKESELIAKSNIVFVTSQKLLETKRSLNQHTYLMPHGVNRSLFAKAIDENFQMATELRDLPLPVIGCFGNIFEYFDQEFVVAVAKLRPEWPVVIVGKSMTNVDQLRQQPNIHLINVVPYERLPEFCRGFAVGFVAYKPNHPFSQHANPLKMREYLAAGLPVVAIDIPAARALGDFISLVQSPSEFVSAVDQYMATDSPVARRQRSSLMETESWTARVTQMESIITKI